MVRCVLFIGVFPFFCYCIPHHLLVHFPWFITAFLIIYLGFPGQLLQHSPLFLQHGLWCIAVFTMITLWPFQHSPWFISAFPLSYSCFRFDLLPHSQLINGTSHIVYWCVSIFFLLHFPSFISAFPMIYHCISNYLFRLSWSIIAAFSIIFTAWLMMYCCISYDYSMTFSAFPMIYLCFPTGTQTSISPTN